MVRQSAGHAAVGRHNVNVLVAVILRCEGHLAAVRGKHRVRLDPDARGQPLRFAPLAADDPYVAAVGKRDVRAAHGGAAQKQGLFTLTEANRGDSNSQDKGNDRLERHHIPSVQTLIQILAASPMTRAMARGKLRHREAPITAPERHE